MTKLTAAAIRDAINSTDPRAVQAAIDAAEVQAPEARAAADAGRAAAIDPSLTDTEARAARKAADDAAFAADRMEAAEAALRARLDALEAAEDQRGKMAGYTAAKALLEAAQARVVQDWDAACAVLADITLRMEAATAAVDSANRPFNLPEGAEPIALDYVWRQLREKQTGELKSADGRRVLARLGYAIDPARAWTPEEVETKARKGMK